MANKKINPTGFRLSIKQSWWSLSDCSHTYQDQFIRKLIKGTFNAFNILTSEIGIKRKGRKHIFIDLLVYPYNFNYPQQDKLFKDPLFPHNIFNYSQENINNNSSNPRAHNPNNVSVNSDNPILAQRGLWPLLTDSKDNNLKNPSLYLNGNFEFRYVYVKSLIEYLLGKRFQNPKYIISISLTQAPSVASNAKILGDWIDLEIRKNPLKHRLVLNKAKNLYLEYQNATIVKKGENSKNNKHTGYLETFKNTLKNTTTW